MNTTLSETTRIVTFGCRLNSYESEVIKDLAQKAGLNNAIVVNTCAVTSEAERQARQAIRKMRRENPDAQIIVTGCGAQINPKQYSDMPEVTRVIGNEEKLKLESYLQNPDHLRVSVNDIMSIKETAGHLIAGFEGKSRAFVQIQNGCNHRCTFCTIPFGRGNSRSVAVGEITTQVRKLMESGYQEIVLTGVDITDYGADLPGSPTLGQMIRRLLALVPELKRLRLSSLDPVEIDPDLWRLIAEEPRLMPHLHISLQAGDDMILKRMKRRHLRKDVIDFCKQARDYRPDVAFGADLIAGFPTETEEMFLNGYQIIEECDLTYLHVFPYSSRPGTPASRMPQLAKSLIKERASLLRQAGDQALSRFFDIWLGKTTEILIESVSAQEIHGKTNHFAPVVLESSGDIQVNSLLQVKMTDKNATHLIGSLNV
jgi:threonylcarbamoyladenosine tRNA methylthiotransferase MtaB